MIHMDIKTVIQELQYYNISEYDLHGLFKSCIKQDIKISYNYHVDDKLLIEMDTIENSVIATTKNILDKFGTFKTARMYQEIDGHSSYITFNPDNPTVFRVREYGMDNFVMLMQLAISRKLESDRTLALAIVDKHKGLTYPENRGGTIEITYPEKDTVLKCRTYKNGNVRVSGLTEDMIEFLKDTYKMYDDIRYGR